MATIRKVTQEVLDRVTGELAAAEGTLVAAVEAHDLACSMVAADIEVGEISVGDAAARTTATGEQLERAKTLVDRLSRALPELVARLGLQAEAEAERAAAKRAAEVTKLCGVANAVSRKLASALGAAEELAGVLLLARAAVDGLADTAGAGKGGTADPALSGARPPAAHARGTGLNVPPTGFLDEPEWGRLWRWRPCWPRAHGACTPTCSRPRRSAWRRSPSSTRTSSPGPGRCLLSGCLWC